MNQKLTGWILVFLCACTSSCCRLRDADIAPGASCLYFPTDHETPDVRLDLTVYLDDKIIVQTNLPLTRVEASCAGMRYPIQTLIADGEGACEHLDVTIDKSNREGIGFSFKRASSSHEDNKGVLDIVREELMIPYKVRSKGRSNRVSYSAQWRK